jgi:Sulfotransferase domain
MALEVIGAGFGRTGTLSLKTALEMLGFGPCHHMVEVLANPGQAAFWNRAAMGEAVDWEDVYGPYRSTVDWPGCHFYAQLSDYYPRAKIVLSTRDPERWYDSMSETIIPSMKSMGLIDDLPEDHFMLFGGLIITRDTFGGDFSKANVIAAFERHNAKVQRTIPSERLLVFEASQGWEPLCAHLGVAVPSEPFPRVNDREEFQKHAQKGRELSGL